MINRYQKAWIWFWYNDMTRIFLVLFPSYFVILIPLLLWFGVSGEMLGKTLGIVYLYIFAWAAIDSDYSKLEKIGLDVWRRPLGKKGDDS